MKIVRKINELLVALLIGEEFKTYEPFFLRLESRTMERPNSPMMCGVIAQPLVE